ncbi:CPBP family intramembrane glutamic endopeptidase [Paenibacillus sp. MMS18-CY102]|uniref:CPBP family intramembrane glutamic endopeptidase n=1 Tax=Paenibacillus sp. MMS18-CY102 TaxID=2682849 RepID=UPI0013658EA8|nr:CPBP family intramembrane glutamic endopeptidase [Paenibacillus sp. MMS18-CY102]MWC26808.1 CPBP family intramembrane metalloprotease [Paenibacillus sp. MMS18-CY102]
MTETPLLPQRIPRILTILGVIGLLLFGLLQLSPIFTASSPEDADIQGNGGVITRVVAGKKAIALADERFGGAADAPHTVHQSDSLLYGYLSKENKLLDFAHTYDSRFPTDTFQSQLHTKYGELFVYTHMESGRIVGWRLFPIGDDRTKSSARYVSEWTKLQFARKAAIAEGFRSTDLRDSQVNGEIVTFQPKGYKIGDAQLMLRISVMATDQSGALRATSYHAAFEAPRGYIADVERQDKLAASLSLFGSLLMNALLFLFAIIMAIRTRRSTSFRRGLLLAGLFLLFYVANNYSMADGIRASYGERPNADTLTVAGLLFSNLFTGLMAVSVWFSLIGGDGIWRRDGRRLWSRYGEPGYGDHVWRAMKLSYPLALVMLGAQSILLYSLDRSIGSWSTTSVESSPYNLAIPLLYPLLAWCAAISEEAIYRLFGIAWFTKVFRNKFVGCLIPTIIWALGHVTYPVYPAYSRLIELTIVGLLFCWLFLRYGFVTAVLTHAILDTILMAFDLITLGTVVNWLAALFYLALPVGIAWALRKMANRGRNADTA